MVTHKEAQEIANKIKSISPHIESVEIAGSVATKGIGNDLDLVLIVSDEHVADWLRHHPAAYRAYWPNLLYPVRKYYKKIALPLFDYWNKERKSDRLTTIEEILDCNFDELLGADGKQVPVDLFLMPAGWRNEAGCNFSVLQKHTNLTDHGPTRGFLTRLAESARVVA